jgi:hypothetical protein
MIAYECPSGGKEECGMWGGKVGMTVKKTMFLYDITLRNTIIKKKIHGSRKREERSNYLSKSGGMRHPATTRSDNTATDLMVILDLLFPFQAGLWITVQKEKEIKKTTYFSEG